MSPGRIKGEGVGVKCKPSGFTSLNNPTISSWYLFLNEGIFMLSEDQCQKYLFIYLVITLIYIYLLLSLHCLSFITKFHEKEGLKLTPPPTLRSSRSAIDIYLRIITTISLYMYLVVSIVRFSSKSAQQNAYFLRE